MRFFGAVLYQNSDYRRMKAQLIKRLADLRQEFKDGQRMLAELEAKETALRITLLRISGAVQVLEEELAKYENNLPDGKKLKDDGAGDSEFKHACGESSLRAFDFKKQTGFSPDMSTSLNTNQSAGD